MTDVEAWDLWRAYYHRCSGTTLGPLHGQSFVFRNAWQSFLPGLYAQNSLDAKGRDAIDNVLKENAKQLLKSSQEIAELRQAVGTETGKREIAERQRDEAMAKLKEYRAMRVTRITSVTGKYRRLNVVSIPKHEPLTSDDVLRQPHAGEPLPISAETEDEQTEIRELLDCGEMMIRPQTTAPPWARRRKA